MSHVCPSRRKHLNHPDGAPPQDAEDLFRLLKEAANKFNAEPGVEPAVRRSRRPGDFQTL